MIEDFLTDKEWVRLCELASPSPSLTKRMMSVLAATAKRTLGQRLMAEAEEDIVKILEAKEAAK